MKLNNKCKILLICFVCICLPIISLAKEKLVLPQYTEEYQRWLELPAEERKKHIEPPMYDLSKEDEKTQLFVDKNILGAVQLPEKYTLSYYGDVKNQGNTNACWAYSAATVFDTNYYKTSSEKKKFSNMHMEYVTAQEFCGFNRKVDDGGNMMLALAYATNGTGIAQESSMPQVINPYTIKNVKPDSMVSEYVILGNEYQIKKHIYEYGAVSSYTYIGNSKYFSNPNVSNEKNLAYLCTNRYMNPNHAITLIGWDDNYTNTAFPGYQGAYIVLNSYGKNFGNNGIYYIFYDDVFVQGLVFGVKETKNIDYAYIYQHDECGGSAYIGANTDTIYAANVFTRKNMNKREIIKDVSVYIPQAGKITIYINPNGSDLSVSKATNKRTVTIAEPGYHTIRFDEGIEINSNKFVVGVKYPEVIGIEAGSTSGWLSSVKSNYNESYVSFDGQNYDDIKTIEGLDSVNACIKAFTIVQDKPIQKFPESDVKLPRYVFDARYYAEKNQDIVAIMGDNPKVLTWHFLNAGIREGRKSSPTFCVADYVKYNQDLLLVYGRDYMAFYNHFVNWGCYEGRRSSDEFDPFFYRYYYHDLTGFSHIRLLEQYVNNGIYEGRIGALDPYTDAIVYDPEVYMGYNQDLIAVFGYDQQKFKQHWLQYGIDENRKASILYEARAYKDYNQDLYQAIGDSNRAFFEHYVKWGLNELRRSSYVFEITTYLKYNSELTQAYGDEYKLMYLHFRNFGLEEGRISSNRFYIGTYMKYNSDLHAVYGMNRKFFCAHYLAYGKYEGRKAI